MPSRTLQANCPVHKQIRACEASAYASPLRGNRGQLSEPPGLGLEFPGQISHPLSTSFQLVWQTVQTSERGAVAETDLRGIQELKEEDITVTV